MNKRYLAALLLSVLVLIGYPYYLQWVGVRPAQKSNVEVRVEPEKAPSLSKEKPATDPGQALPYRNALYDLVFSSRGGNLILLQQGDAILYQAKPQEKGIFGVTLQHETPDLSGKIFQVIPPEKKELPPAFVYEKSGEYRITKKYFAGSEKPTLILEVEIQNLSSRERQFPLQLNYALNLALHGPRDEASAKMVLQSGPQLQAVHEGSLRKKPFLSIGAFEWQGLARKYYALLVKPDLKLSGQETRFEEDRLVSDLEITPFNLGAGEKKTVRFLIYAGPQHYGLLREVGFGFEKVLSQGMLGILRIALLISLNFFYRIFGNYGVAILMITLLLKLLFTPLTHLSYQSMGKMQALQPKIKALQKKHQGDAGRLNKEMMELYRRNRVNPMMGCLPLFLQIPIFIAFYQALSEAVEMKGAHFIFWIRDLSEPDRLFSWTAALPFVGNSFNLLPILMIGSMIWQQKLTPQTAAAPGQEKMMLFMPVIFGFVFYSLPSGLVLYWLTNNLLTIFHQLVIKRIPVILHHEDR